MRICLFHSVFIVIFFGLLAGFFFLAFQCKQSKREYEQLRLEVHAKNRQLANNEEEIRLLIQDKAKLIGSYTKSYQFEEFGIYSPHFLDSQVETLVYRYRRNVITEMILEIPQKNTEDEQVKVEVWKFSGPSQDSSFGSADKRLVIFDSWLNPIPLSELKERWQGKYKNKNSIEMYRAFDVFQPALSMIYYLEFFQENSPNGHSVFVRLSTSSKFLADVTAFEQAPQELVGEERMRRLEKIADSIDIKLQL